MDLPARHHHPRGPHLPGARRPRPAAHRDVRRLVAGARPGVPLRPAGHDGAPAQRLVPRPARRPGQVGPDLLARAQGRMPPSRRRSWPWAAERRAGRGDVRRPRLRPRRRRAVRWPSAGCPSFGLDFQPRSYAATAAGRRRRTARRPELLALQPARAARACSPAGADHRPAARRAAAHRPAPRRHPSGLTRAPHLWRLARMMLAGGEGGPAAVPRVPRPRSATTATPGSSTSSGAGRG